MENSETCRRAAAPYPRARRPTSAFGTPPSRALARLSSNARAFAALVASRRPTRARSSSPDASRLFDVAPALHRAESTTFSRDDDPRARIRRRRRPRRRPRARSRAPRAHSRPRHARARPGNPGRKGATHPPRLRPGIRLSRVFAARRNLRTRARSSARHRKHVSPEKRLRGARETPSLRRTMCIPHPPFRSSPPVPSLLDP